MKTKPHWDRNWKIKTVTLIVCLNWSVCPTRLRLIVSICVFFNYDEMFGPLVAPQSLLWDVSLQHIGSHAQPSSPHAWGIKLVGPHLAHSHCLHEKESPLPGSLGYFIFYFLQHYGFFLITVAPNEFRKGRRSTHDRTTINWQWLCSPTSTALSHGINYPRTVPPVRDFLSASTLAWLETERAAAAAAGDAVGKFPLTEQFHLLRWLFSLGTRERGKWNKLWLQQEMDTDPEMLCKIIAILA